eukprot:CAMPEP_0198314880 /NCGR_PEP_ID=MMETSP1450-20131203/5357_1 /TAXON_ID=753684 ORGANISM="Madagascaria erythrocladiodes, Strain CCMP3234" /NCGR_SAMPLE_ID=MMETSP1450 /ASSEMBLY_ACC=CAM_ASM_001115 /LENGTH=237 /DNA_ID=CAMNT_0044017965 /DNA_START=62 /DNA_END=772 /DNA_ORIENTATION=+
MCRYALSCCVLLVAVVVGFITTLAANDELRSAWFAYVFSRAKAKQSEGEVRTRCDLLDVVDGGRVLEIGFGTGANLVCLKERSAEQLAALAEWIAVEPNANFHPHINASAVRIFNTTADRLPFALRVAHAKAEDMRDVVPDASVDFVVSTHVLCSVDDVRAVLAEIHRVLRPGGKFVFLEHVLADAERHGAAVAAVQRAVAPVFFVVGDGCTFRDIAAELRASYTPRGGGGGGGMQL